MPGLIQIILSYCGHQCPRTCQSPYPLTIGSSTGRGESETQPMGSDCPATECPLLVQLNPDHGTMLFFPKGPESLSINFEVDETPSNSPRIY